MTRILSTFVRNERCDTPLCAHSLLPVVGSPPLTRSSRRRYRNIDKWETSGDDIGRRKRAKQYETWKSNDGTVAGDEQYEGKRSLRIFGDENETRKNGMERSGDR